MLNSVNLQGRLTDTPVPQLTKSGTYVLNFCIAVEEMITGKNEKKVNFFKCVAWGKTADFISRNFCKDKEIISVCSIIKQLELFIVPKSQQEYRVKSCKQKGSCQIAEIHCENRKCNG